MVQWQRVSWLGGRIVHRGAQAVTLLYIVPPNRWLPTLNEPKRGAIMSKNLRIAFLGDLNGGVGRSVLRQQLPAFESGSPGSHP